MDAVGLERNKGSILSCFPNPMKERFHTSVILEGSWDHEQTGLSVPQDSMYEGLLWVGGRGKRGRRNDWMK